MFPQLTVTECRGLSSREYTDYLAYAIRFFEFENAMNGQYRFQNHEGFEDDIARDFLERCKNGF